MPDLCRWRECTNFRHSQTGTMYSIPSYRHVSTWTSCIRTDSWLGLPTRAPTSSQQQGSRLDHSHSTTSMFQCLRVSRRPHILMTRRHANFAPSTCSALTSMAQMNSTCMHTSTYKRRVFLTAA